ncbi:MAG: thiamine pyrophosphate-dependent dehydrogenase E1 component subunit alpha [Chthoniobacteraceae bacterium]
MSSTAAVPATRTDNFQARYLQAYRWMLLARLSEEKVAALYRGGKIVGGVFLGKGQEALSTATAMALKPGDIFAPLIRDQAGRFAFGEPLLDCFRTYLGSRLGPMRGRDGNIHRGSPRDGYFPMISHLGAMIPAVAGALLARRLKGQSGSVGATCIGDGGTSTGAFHEGLNLAAVEKLPLIVVVANNRYAYSTPNSRQFACADLLDRAAGYGVEGHHVDATDLAACLATLQNAADRARAGHGPQFILGSLLRLVGHGEHDDASYVDPALKKAALDCLLVAEDRIIAEQWATPADFKSWRADATARIEEAVATSLREPAPDPNEEQWTALSTPRLREGYIEE